MQLILEEILKAFIYLVTSAIVYYIWETTYDESKKEELKKVLGKWFLVCFTIAFFSSISMGQPYCTEKDPVFGYCEGYYEDGFEVSNEQRVARFLFVMILLYTPAFLGALKGNNYINLLKIRAKEYAEKIFNFEKEGEIEKAKMLIKSLEDESKEFWYYLEKYYEEMQIDEELEKLGIDKNIKSWDIDKIAIYLANYLKNLRNEQGIEKMKEVINKLDELGIITLEVEELINKYMEKEEGNEI